MDIDRVIRDYRTGNEDKRIILFLAYRDLRAEFSDIQQEPDGTVNNPGIWKRYLKTIFQKERR